jgi:hypothetical protein
MDGADLILAQGPQKTFASRDKEGRPIGWMSLADIEEVAEDIIAAVPAWKAQVQKAIMMRTPGIVCTASVWLADRRYLALQPVESDPVEDEVPAEFTAFLEAAKGLFDRSGSATDVLKVWNVTPEKTRDLAKRALRFRGEHLDGLTKDCDSDAEYATKLARREQAIRGVKLEQWLLRGDWIEHKAELDQEVPGFKILRPAIIEKILEWLRTGQEWVVYMAESARSELFTVLGKVAPTDPASNLPADLLAEVQAKHAEWVVEERERRIRGVRRIWSGEQGNYQRDQLRQMLSGERKWYSGGDFGPAPGEPGCFIPQDIIDQVKQPVSAI